MKSRFCPSPTGNLHLGNMRTALFNVLLAKSEQGVFLLRIEDTDKTRSMDEYADALMEDLHSLDLDWQEGPRVDGEHGPYWQSQRQAIYDEYYEKLLASGDAYHCFCSEEQLALNRKIQRANGQPPRYPGTCANLSAEEVTKKLEAGQSATLRFNIPNEGAVKFTDSVRGDLHFECSDMGDFVIRRADGTASFMYCNALDDALMGVTHVLRGEDHLTNTPRQMLILETLNLPCPHYGHISLLLGKDGAPLSKRNGSRSVKELRESGYLPVAILNYLARLGHHYADDNFMSLDELASLFRLKSLVKAPARFDEKQLDRWQQIAIQRADAAELWHWAPDEINEIVPEDDRFTFVKAVQANVCFPQDVVVWANAVYSDHIEHSQENLKILKEAGVNFFEKALEIINDTQTDFKVLAKTLQTELGVKGKALYLPLRVALTGEMHGPEMRELLPLMGVARAKQRLEYALYHV